MLLLETCSLTEICSSTPIPIILLLDCKSSAFIIVGSLRQVERNLYRELALIYGDVATSVYPRSSSGDWRRSRAKR